MTVHEIKNEIRERLTGEVCKPEADAISRMILEEVKGYSAAEQVMFGDRTLLPETVKRIRGIVERVVNGEPLQYVLGRAWWHGRTFEVNPWVLIPRPETSQLVDMIVDENKGRRDLRALDIGTGSGCIAVSLSLDLPFADVDAIDISEKAIATAVKNAENNRAIVTYYNIDIFHIDKSILANKKYDIIVSNPPYILESERTQIDPRVKDHEPATALFVDDNHSIEIYRKIISFSASNLEKDGKLYLEINPLCADKIRKALNEGGLREAETLCDYTGTERFATAKKY